MFLVISTRLLCAVSLNYYDDIWWKTFVIFWHVPPSSVVDISKRFGGTYCHILQGQRISRESKQ
jgi:hypothetical protein